MVEVSLPVTVSGYKLNKVFPGVPLKEIGGKKKQFKKTMTSFICQKYRQNDKAGGV